MKKVLSILFLSVLLLNSCSEEDDTTYDPIDPALVVGTWELTDSDIDATTTLDVLGQGVTTRTNTSLVSSSTTITFNDDGTFVAAGTTTYITTTPGSPDETNSIDITGTSGTYVISENTITFSESIFLGGLDGQVADRVTPEYNISALSENRMIIDVSGEARQDVLGQPVTLGMDGFIQLEK
jgi:hypothetical protein